MIDIGECMLTRNIILKHEDAFVTMRWARYLNQTGMDEENIKRELKRLSIILASLRSDVTTGYLTYPDYILIKNVTNVLQKIPYSRE